MYEPPSSNYPPQPNYQQPPYGHMPRPYGHTPPPPKPPRKRRKLKPLDYLIIGFEVFVALVVLSVCSVVAITALHRNPASNYQYQWESTYTFSGSGDKKTESFTPHGPGWKLAWSCTPSSSYIDSYNLIVHVVNNSDNTIADYAINTICKPGNTQMSRPNT